MKLCANLSLLFTEHKFLERFGAARDCGFSAVEIQFPYSEQAPALQQEIDNYQLQVALINIPAGDLMDGGYGLASHPKRRDQFKRAVEQCLLYADALAVERVNLLAGNQDPDYDREHLYDTFLENLDYCATQLSQHNIATTFEAINTEDMPNFLINCTEHMVKVIRDLNNRHVSMQYDLYHMAKMREPISQQLPDIIQHIGHVQFADTPDRQQPGTGELPFEELMMLLSSLNYQHWVGAEYKPSNKTAASLEWKDWFENHFPQ
ncbi:MAG: hydroxypyruvate isomerase [Cellvibrionaceae bacterium]|nr:hydroxypyruvate isomerase [Cellvibrionaceae bacterium]|tara:strand:+ start:17202 stop:17990 length:789 start_codon:yes stop_codon:yes gene_type:complete